MFATTDPTCECFSYYLSKWGTKVLLIVYRLSTPEPTNKVGLFPRLGSRFRYSGRTHSQTKTAPIERAAPQFERSLSGRRLASKSMDRKCQEYRAIITAFGSIRERFQIFIFCPTSKFLFKFSSSKRLYRVDFDYN